MSAMDSVEWWLGKVDWKEFVGAFNAYRYGGGDCTVTDQVVDAIRWGDRFKYLRFEYLNLIGSTLFRKKDGKEFVVKGYSNGFFTLESLNRNSIRSKILISSEGIQKQMLLYSSEYSDDLVTLKEFVRLHYNVWYSLYLVHLHLEKDVYEKEYKKFRSERIKRGFEKSGYVHKGRKPDKEKHNRIRQLNEFGLSKEEICRVVGCGIATVYRVIGKGG